MTALRILDIGDDPDFRRIPPCADPRFDHRTCDYWEDADRGARDSRQSWLTAPPPVARPARTVAPDNPFASAPREEAWNPFSTGGGAGGLAAVSGYPHLTVPMGAVRGLPVGLSFIGPAWSEAQLLGLGFAYEQASKARVTPTFVEAVEARPDVAALLVPPK